MLRPAIVYIYHHGDPVASWLVCSTPYQDVRVRVLAEDNASCSRISHLFLTGVSLHPGV